MPWAVPVTALAASVSPLDATAGSITGYLLGYGPIGIFLVAMTWLLFRGWRIIPPAREDEIRTAARDDGRADLLRENDRLIADKAHIQEQRDDALRIAQTQIVPLLIEFNATTAALLPLLQELVSRREGHERGTRRP